MAYEISLEESGVVIRYSGALSWQDVFASAKEDWGAERWDTLKYEIFDFLDVQTVTIDEDHAVAMSAMDDAATRSQALQRPKKSAFVVTNPDIAKFIEIYIKAAKSNLRDLRVFDNEYDARQWAQSVETARQVPRP